MVTSVKRIKSAGFKEETSRQDCSSENSWRGFGYVKGETLDQFHDRMFDLPPLEAIIYEMDVEFARH